MDRTGIYYDGSQLRSQFNYELSKQRGDSIICFKGPMSVSEHMVDTEDRIEEDFIWSPYAYNFIIEIFHINIETIILYQRHLMSIITKVLERNLTNDKYSVDLNGDDIMVTLSKEKGPRKLSVSIATVSHISGLIHTGLNIKVDDTIPVPAIGLSNLFMDFSDSKLDIMISNCMEEFKRFVIDIKKASVKVRGV